MSIKCLMNGLEVNYPCSPSCALFGDCVTAFESQKKANVRTNADRIRSMNDEELAWYLMLWRCEAVAKHHGIESEYPDTQKTILKWLQQPAEEDDHENL